MSPWNESSDESANFSLSFLVSSYSQDLVKSHLMYAVREEVEVLKEQIKELYERNSVLERENAVLKSLANSDQLNQLTNQLTQGSSTSPPLQQQQQQLAVVTNSTTPMAHHEGSQSVPHQPNITSAWSPFPRNTRSNTHLPQTGVDPVRKDNNYYRPLSSIKQKARLCVLYAPFEEKINNSDIFVYHREQCFSVCMLLLPGLYIIKTFTTPWEVLFWPCGRLQESCEKEV